MAMADADLHSVRQAQVKWVAGDADCAENAVETDPSNRYLRYPALLGRGACKRVYKAFDQHEGIEVAWNQVELSGNTLDHDNRERLFAEIRVLKTLTHRNIIKFYDWWYDCSNQTINFITEYFTSGTLRQYRKKHKHISEQAIKRWAFQILEGLLYLHAHDPPIMHRDLKCDNILINGTSGQVKIADLGMASCQRGLSVVGTPEFIAPEVYDETYNEKVDIYSFGMCVLELATLEYPYSECRSIPAIFRKVSQGIPPAGLARVSSSSLREFITLCINPVPDNRPSALQLLKHDFFEFLRTGKPQQHMVVLFSFNEHEPHAAVAAGAATSPAAPEPGQEVCSTGSSAAADMRQPAAFIGSGQGQGKASTGAVTGSLLSGSTSSGHSSAGWPTVSGSGSSSGAGDAAAAVTVTVASGSGRPSKLEWLLQQQEGHGRAAGQIQRGSTVCVAALGRGNSQEYEEDSDDEVLVCLEDVLMPHPDDLLDPDHPHTHVTHGPSGCIILATNSHGSSESSSSPAPAGAVPAAALAAVAVAELQTAAAAAGAAAASGRSRPSSTGALGCSPLLPAVYLERLVSDTRSSADGYGERTSPAVSTPNRLYLPMPPLLGKLLSRNGRLKSAASVAAVASAAQPQGRRTTHRKSGSVGCEQLDGLEAADGCITLSENREQKPCQAISVPCTRISSAHDMHHQPGQQQQVGQQILSADHLHGNGQASAVTPATRTLGSEAPEDELGAAADTERPSGPRAASAAAVVVGGGGGAAGGGGAGARIVVRRRFARQLQPAVLSVTRYEEDAHLAAGLGCNGFRLSLEWSRLEPRRGFVDPAAVRR
eukprot:gene9149-9317_t